MSSFQPHVCSCRPSLGWRGRLGRLVPLDHVRVGRRTGGSSSSCGCSGGCSGGSSFSCGWSSPICSEVLPKQVHRFVVRSVSIFDDVADRTGEKRRNPTPIIVLESLDTEIVEEKSLHLTVRPANADKQLTTVLLELNCDTIVEAHRDLVRKS